MRVPKRRGADQARRRGVRWLILAGVILLLRLGPAVRVAATRVSASDPNSVVPPAFCSHLDLSQEGDWHWVEISHDGTHRVSTPSNDVSIGKRLPSVYFVSTRVRALEANDLCKDCLMVGPSRQGPSSILGWTENAVLCPAYQNIENGPRRQLKEDSADGSGTRWTYGSWYLNYSPITHTFFS